MPNLRGDILHSKVNAWLGILLIGSFVLGAGLIVWHMAFGADPLTDAFAAEIAAETQTPQ